MSDPTPKGINNIPPPLSVAARKAALQARHARFMAEQARADEHLRASRPADNRAINDLIFELQMLRRVLVDAVGLLLGEAA